MYSAQASLFFQECGVQYKIGLIYGTGLVSLNITFVLVLTFDLIFCRLFSFFLVKAFFPLKYKKNKQIYFYFHIQET